MRLSPKVQHLGENTPACRRIFCMRTTRREGGAYTQMFITLQQLDDAIWPEALRIYHESFPQAGRKPDAILTGMFDKEMAYLHAKMTDGAQMAAMAITGIIAEAGLLLIDYVAVRQALRYKRIGMQFINDVKHWARDAQNLQGIIIEVEAEAGEENAGRIRFWEKCGFTLTNYVHRYRWVPERYRAMYVSFTAAPTFPTDGETLFQYIGAFHAKAFRK